MLTYLEKFTKQYLMNSSRKDDLANPNLSTNLVKWFGICNFRSISEQYYKSTGRFREMVPRGVRCFLYYKAKVPYLKNATFTYTI
jgi:hypothetical protein